MYRTLQKPPPPPGGLVLTDRDTLWIRAVHRFRFLTTDQAELIAGAINRNSLNARLRLLWAHDYLDRPALQIRFSYDPKRDTVHALGQRGAEWLARNDGVEFPKGKGWRTANQLKSEERLRHRIGTVDAMLRFQRDVEGRDGLRMIHQDELLALTDWPPGLRHFRLPTQTMFQGRRVDRATDPDYTFAIAKRIDGNERKALFFLEYDNSTEDFIKSNRLASSIAQKHRCYLDAYRRKLAQDLYDSSNFRVLFVVSGGPDHIAKMQHVFERVIGEPRVAGLFLYTTIAALAAEGPLAPIWQNGAGEPARLV